MANQELVELLKQGVVVWNRWRRTYQEIEPNLSEINLSETNLSGADLSVTNLIGTNLSDADLSGADLTEANLIGANLNSTNIYGICLSNTVIARVDLCDVKGLDTVIHRGPSTIDANTVRLPEGETRTLFLRGVGFSDIFIDYYHALFTTAIQDTIPIIV